ncbi:Uncharacterized protein K02A2.6 [Araneus ventricosus]|uniref:Uncharacterized protein K02A2.6 n=1 Tax=Araneus ventricosus TaxID=182803 RepID=A0A4Y2DYF9_ARAVE|nr:Uncharacterized protein K02A2.6 [Araneus ventricosus]
MVSVSEQEDRGFENRFFEDPLRMSAWCRKIKQKQHEEFQELYTRLKLAAEDCNYDKPERILRDNIVQGINDKPLQERLLRETSRKQKTLQEIVNNYAPSVAVARKIPLVLHDKVKAELNRIENMSVITKVEPLTEWVSNIIVIDNHNKLRICIDPRPLTEAIKIPHYPIPSADRLMTNLQGSTVFSIFDLKKNGFWQLASDEESSYLTAFATPWGRYRLLVLPYGLNNSPEEFQKATEEMLKNEPNVIPYFDDICIGSKTMEEHCQTLRNVLNIARKII